MQPDYKKYPEIPRGCQLNENKKSGTFQIFREGKYRSEGCTSKRESIGTITKDGKLVFSDMWVLRNEVRSLRQQLTDLKNAHEVGGTNEKSETADEHARTVCEQLTQVIDESHLDLRHQSYVSVPMATICLGALISGLSGGTDCVAIGDFITQHADFFAKYFPDCDFSKVSHDTVRRALMMVDVTNFEEFMKLILSPLVKPGINRVIAADGQAVRATGKYDSKKDCVSNWTMMMNFYDVSNRVVLAHRAISEKTNEITVGPAMLENLNVAGSIVTADAMSCQVNFVEKVLDGGANYCISLKGNQEKSWNEVMCLFNTVHPDQIIHAEGDWEFGHGRIERRDISMIRGVLLSTPIKEKWPGLAEGAIVKVRSYRERKNSTRKGSWEDRYYITSLPAKKNVLAKVAEVIRSHWGVENNLHWMLDNLFQQDRVQAEDPAYISNRTALNKICLALLENYRFYLWDHGLAPANLSLGLLQKRCHDPMVGIRCIGYALGWLK